MRAHPVSRTDEPNSRTPFKPGIVSHHSGSALHLRVDTSGMRRPSVALQYLESHVGMGVVEGSCGGCACAPFRIDARGRIARQSTNSWHYLEVSAHSACELRLLLLNATAAAPPQQQNVKFKLVRLILTEDAADAAEKTAEGSRRGSQGDMAARRDAPASSSVTACVRPQLRKSCAARLQQLASLAAGSVDSGPLHPPNGTAVGADAAAPEVGIDDAHRRRAAALTLLHAARKEKGEQPCCLLRLRSPRVRAFGA